jgi:hypothetical protein
MIMGISYQIAAQIPRIMVSLAAGRGGWGRADGT